MAKQDTTQLADAAAAFDESFASYARLGELFLKTPLSSAKLLERANKTLTEIAACEHRLQAAGQALVEALSAVRAQQEQLSHLVVAHVPIVQQRNQRLAELMSELTGVAGEIGGLNTQIQSKGGNGNALVPHVVDAQNVSDTLLGLSARAEALSVAARDAEFEEISTQAHALHQRLLAIGKKLQKTDPD
jgi:hypothetical protein